LKGGKNMEKQKVKGILKGEFKNKPKRGDILTWIYIE